MTPTPKWQKQHPHIWRATQLQQLRTHYNTIDFDLCSFGHHCKASTRLLALNWPNLTDTIRQRPNSSKCTCHKHDFDPHYQQQTAGSFHFPQQFSDLIVSTLQILPRQQSTSLLDDTDYAAYLPLDPYYYDHIAPAYDSPPDTYQATQHTADATQLPPHRAQYQTIRP